MKKKTPTPTLAERASAATADLEHTVSTFEDVVARLDAVTATHDAIAEEVDAEIERLTVLRFTAGAQADRAERIAGRVRELVA